jgi:hypothetical protein
MFCVNETWLPPVGNLCSADGPNGGWGDGLTVRAAQWQDAPNRVRSALGSRTAKPCAWRQTSECGSSSEAPRRPRDAAGSASSKAPGKLTQPAAAQRMCARVPLACKTSARRTFFFYIGALDWCPCFAHTTAPAPAKAARPARPHSMQPRAGHQARAQVRQTYMLPHDGAEALVQLAHRCCAACGRAPPHGTTRSAAQRCCCSEKAQVGRRVMAPLGLCCSARCRRPRRDACAHATQSQRHQYLCRPGERGGSAACGVRRLHGARTWGVLVCKQQRGSGSCALQRVRATRRGAAAACAQRAARACCTPLRKRRVAYDGR